jgi:ribosomal protein S18 acetylase RimI-like enzyme
MHVRPYAGRDAAGVDAVLDAAYPDDPRVRALKRAGHGAPREQPFRRTLVAQVDDGVVATGTIVHGPLHPRRTWIDVVVAPPFRRRGIGSAVLRELRTLAGRPLRTRGIFADEAALGFLRAHGFGLLSSTYEGRFDPAAVAARLPEPQLGRPPAAEEAAAFFDGWYAATHRFDPPLPRTPDRALAVFCGDDIAAGSLVGVRDARGRLVAAANLVRPPGRDAGDELYLVWAGTLETEPEAATDVVAACVHFARAAGTAVRYEVAAENGPVLRGLERLGVVGEPAFGVFADDVVPRAEEG